ncbi:MAG: flavin reductase [Bacteroidales bacterium]|nr:flavin reductase [Bacteroidales bacterium]MCF8390336.1 flavin reductase [Bacteroidales bacterium]
MNRDFKKIKPVKIDKNLIQLVGKDWMLITAGELSSYNTMTASWGQMGVLWNLPVAICYIRPQRFTFEFVEKADYYTLSFFENKYRKALNFCGSKSGRDFDKAKETGLSAFETELGNISFAEASLILECKKLYADDIKENKFIQRDLAGKHYPQKDFHRFYIGEICETWIKK